MPHDFWVIWGRLTHQRLMAALSAGVEKTPASFRSGLGWVEGVWRTITLPASGRGDHRKPDTLTVTPDPAAGEGARRTDTLASRGPIGCERVLGEGGRSWPSRHSPLTPREGIIYGC